MEAQSTGATVFHAGTKLMDDRLITDGGRVLGVTAMADDFQGAIASAYHAMDKISFEGIYFRRDIGHRIMRN